MHFPPSMNRDRKLETAARRGLVSSALCAALCAPVAAQSAAPSPGHELPAALTLDWEEQSGETTWGFEFPLAVDQSSDATFVASGRIASPYQLQAFELNGDLRWAVETPIALGSVMAVAPNGSRVYVIGHDWTEAAFRRAVVLAFDASTGAQLWKSYFTSWSGQALVQAPQDLLLSADGSTLFVGGQENEIATTIKGFGTVGAFDADTGQALWLRRFEPPVNHIWSIDRLELGQDAETLYVAGGSGSLADPELLVAAVEVSTGFSRWERLLPAGRPFALAARPDGSELAVASERAGLGPDLFLLSDADGSERLNVSLGDALISAAYSADGLRLIVNAIQDGFFPGSQLDQLTTYGLSSTSGLTVWTRGFDAPWGSPGGIDFNPDARGVHLVYDDFTNSFVVGGSRQPQGGPEDHHLVAYGGNSGTVLWSESFDVTVHQTDQRLMALDLDPMGQRLAVLGDAADLLDLQSVRVGTRDLVSGQLLSDLTVSTLSAAADSPIGIAVSESGEEAFLLNQTNFGKYRLSGHSGATGAAEWSTTLEIPGAGFDPLPPAIAASSVGDRAFLELPSLAGGELRAFEHPSGELAWTRSSPALSGSGDDLATRLIVDDENSQVLLGGLSPLGGLEVLSYGFDGNGRWLAETSPGAKLDAFGGIALRVADNGAERVVLVGVRTGGQGAISLFSKSIRLALFEAQTGAEVWSRGFFWTSSYLEIRDVAISKSGDRIALQMQVDGPSGVLTTVLYDAADGSPVWLDTRGSQGQPRRGMGVDFGVDDQLVIFASTEGVGSAADDVLFDAVFAINGQPAWSNRIDAGSGDALGDWSVDADGLLIVGTGTRGLYAPEDDQAFTFGLDAISGTGLWSAGYSSPADLGPPLLDDLGRALTLTPDGNAIFAGYRVWSGEALSDSLLVRYQMPRLIGDVEIVAVGSGGSQVLSLRQPAATFGDLYLIVGSAHGQGPGLPLDGVVVPLVLDAYTLQTISSANAGAYSKTLGFADAAGRATARIDVPAGLSSSLVGLTLHHAAVTIDVGGTWGLSFATNAMPLTFTF